MADKPSTVFPWQSYFQRAVEPLFLLGRQRRLLFVNRAWEELTGLSADEARGLLCPRRPPPDAGPWEWLDALCPPPEVFEGKPGRSRRLVRAGDQPPQLWDIEFLPFQDGRGLLCVVGKIAATTVERAASSPLLPQQLIGLRARLEQRYGLEQLTSSLPSMRRVADQVRLAAKTHVPVLIIGEPGTGKQWVARTIHHQGLSRGGTFAAVDCFGLPPAALAAILFDDGGLARRSNRGMLYLKEPSRLPRDLQFRLHDLVTATESAPAPAGEARPDGPGPRVVAGCCADPAAEVQAGRLVEDFYCALATVVITLPPLRDREADLEWLTERILEEANADGQRHVTGLTPGAWNLVKAYRWPGNQRELQQVLARARARASGDRIDVMDLPAYVRLAVTVEQTPAATPLRALPLDQLLEQAERRLIVLALRLAQGNKSRAADLLAIWRPRLHRRMEALGITDPEGTPTAGSTAGLDPQQAAAGAADVLEP